MTHHADLTQNACELRQPLPGTLILSSSEVDREDGGNDDEVIRPHREEYELGGETEVNDRQT